MEIYGDLYKNDNDKEITSEDQQLNNFNNIKNKQILNFKNEDQYSTYTISSSELTSLSEIETLLSNSDSEYMELINKEFLREEKIILEKEENINKNKKESLNEYINEITKLSNNKEQKDMKDNNINFKVLLTSKEHKKISEDLIEDKKMERKMMNVKDINNENKNLLNSENKLNIILESNYMFENKKNVSKNGGVTSKNINTNNNNSDKYNEKKNILIKENIKKVSDEKIDTMINNNENIYNVITKSNNINIENTFKSDNESKLSIQKDKDNKAKQDLYEHNNNNQVQIQNDDDNIKNSNSNKSILKNLEDKLKSINDNGNNIKIKINNKIVNDKDDDEIEIKNSNKMESNKDNNKIKMQNNGINIEVQNYTTENKNKDNGITKENVINDIILKDDAELENYIKRDNNLKIINNERDIFEKQVFSNETLVNKGVDGFLKNNQENDIAYKNILIRKDYIMMV
ncbi:hypothetical protein PIROE2DRAFT_58213 [Piromyces sp. E2]|nr:hypothetical protein PIROE2DRAFT_58213 [Piromyces sp. E2]|eukprot:OUM68232.1 hypothetical protein PIROE2DRAFT_58213 [Piromyces sp. E2]